MILFSLSPVGRARKCSFAGREPGDLSRTTEVVLKLLCAQVGWRNRLSRQLTEWRNLALDEVILRSEDARGIP
jgi:hypothetical protein